MDVWHEAPSRPEHDGRRGSGSPQCPAAPFGFAMGGFEGSAPWFSFPLLSQRKCGAAARAGRATCSVVGGKAAAKYACLNPILSHSRRLCMQTGPSIRCTGNCQSELKVLKGQGYNSVLLKRQDFVGVRGREVATNVISSRSTLL